MEKTEKTEKTEKPETRLDKVKKLASRPKRFLRSRRLLKLEGKLRDLKLRLIEKGAVDHALLNFIRETENWRKILSREDLTPSDYYEISQAINDETLKKEAQQKYLAIASEDELDDVIRYGENHFRGMAWQERCERIKKGYIKKRRAKDILIKLFKNTPDYAEKIWSVLQWLETTDKELQSLLDSPFMYRMPELCRKIEKMIRKKKKETENTQLISKIKKIEEKIAKLKEG